MDYKGIIFDLDGVVVTTDKYHYLAWKKLSDEIGVYFDEKINNKLRGVSRMESLEIILEKSERKYSESEKQEMAERKNGYYKELISKMDSSAIIDGAMDFIKKAKDMGILVAIGSSSKNAVTILKKCGIFDEFDAIADGNDITRSKPYPDVFLKAAEKLGLDAGNCLVVEDAVAGVSAGIAAGMDVMAVGDASTDERARFGFCSLADSDILK